MKIPKKLSLSTGGLLISKKKTISSVPPPLLRKETYAFLYFPKNFSHLPSFEKAFSSIFYLTKKGVVESSD